MKLLLYLLRMFSNALSLKELLLASSGAPSTGVADGADGGGAIKASLELIQTFTRAIK